VLVATASPSIGCSWERSLDRLAIISIVAVVSLMDGALAALINQLVCSLTTELVELHLHCLVFRLWSYVVW